MASLGNTNPTPPVGEFGKATQKDPYGLVDLADQPDNIQPPRKARVIRKRKKLVQ